MHFKLIFKKLYKMNNKLNNYLEYNILKINKPEKKYSIIKKWEIVKNNKMLFKMSFQKILVQ